MKIWDSVYICLIKVNSNTIELTMHTSCCCVLDLLCVTSFNIVIFGSKKKPKRTYFSTKLSLFSPIPLAHALQWFKTNFHGISNFKIFLFLIFYSLLCLHANSLEWVDGGCNFNLILSFVLLNLPPPSLPIFSFLEWAKQSHNTGLAHTTHPFFVVIFMFSYIQFFVSNCFTS